MLITGFVPTSINGKIQMNFQNCMPLDEDQKTIRHWMNTQDIHIFINKYLI